MFALCTDRSPRQERIYSLYCSQDVQFVLCCASPALCVDDRVSSVHSATLFLNVLACLAYFCANASRGVDFGLSILWFILFTPVAFVCWYRPVYKAFRYNHMVVYSTPGFEFLSHPIQSQVWKNIWCISKWFFSSQKKKFQGKFNLQWKNKWHEMLWYQLFKILRI